jgi:hypothetical protein
MRLTILTLELLTPFCGQQARRTVGMLTAQDPRMLQFGFKVLI